MSKIHPIHRLIHSLESTEKAYFKRYGFKKESKNNESLKRLFDLLDKQESFDIAKLTADKKLNETVRKHVHVNLNYLQKRIVQSMLDSRRDADRLAVIFNSILEFNFFVEKKIFDLAKNNLKSIEKLVLSNDYFMLKPFIRNLAVDLNRMQLGKDYKMTNTILSNYEYTIDDFSALATTQLVGLKIEDLMSRNGGTFLKTEEDRNIALGLMIKTQEVIALDKKDFQLRSVCANNLYILTLMVGKWQDFEEISSSLIDYYEENMKGKTVAESMFDFLVVLINLTYFSLSLGNDTYVRSLEILKRDQHIVVKGEVKKNLALQIDVLHLLAIALYHANEVDVAELDKYKATFSDVPIHTIEGLGYLRQMVLVLFKRKEYKSLLDDSAQVMQFELQGVHLNAMLVTRFVRVYAWLKLENLSMFDSEINQIYRHVLTLDKESLLKKFVNYLKRLSSFPSEEKKGLEIKKLQAEHNALLEANKVSEYATLKIYMEIILCEASDF